MLRLAAWFGRAVGNGRPATIAIFVFIAVLCLMFYRCARAGEFDLEAGSSVIHGSGPVLGLQGHFPVGNGVDIFAGTDLWGATPITLNNWDWDIGFRACRWRICASLGASYLQVIDRVNGSHTNYYLGLTYELSSRWRLELAHLSDAGTTPVNAGRNALLVAYRLQ